MSSRLDESMPAYQGDVYLQQDDGTVTETLLDTVYAINETAKDYGIEQTDETLVVEGEETYTLDDRGELEEKRIEEVDIEYELSSGESVQLSYDRDVFTSNLFVLAWGDEDFQTDLEEATGMDLEANGWSWLEDLGTRLFGE